MQYSSGLSMGQFGGNAFTIADGVPIETGTHTFKRDLFRSTSHSASSDVLHPTYETEIPPITVGIAVWRSDNTTATRRFMMMIS